MKVAYFALSERYGSGHAGFVHTHSIVKELSRYVDIQLFIQKPGRAADPDIPTCFVVTPNIHLFHTNPARYVKSLRTMKKSLAWRTIIHERFHVNPLDLFFVKGKKYVVEINDPAMILHKGLKGRVSSFLTLKKIKRADALVTQTETLKRILRKFTGKPIFVVPNGVDTALFRPRKKSSLKRELGISEKAKVITFVGSFREWHGVEEIPSIAEEICRRYRNVVFLLVGSGPLFKAVKADIGKKGLEKHVILAGDQNYERIPEFLSISDILIAPFSTKGMPLLDKYGFWWCPVKLFEYMSAGKPIVSYDFKEVRNIIKEKAFLLRRGDVHGFASKLSDIISRPHAYTMRAAQARKRAIKHYDWRKRAEQIYKIYKRVGD